MKRITFILICVLLCSGCVSMPAIPMRMYGGYERSSSQVAIIKKFDKGALGIIYRDLYSAKIEEIDGQKVDPSVGASLRGYEVLPGIHTVKFYVSKASGYNPSNELHLERTIDAKAGHQYEIRAKWHHTRVGVTDIEVVIIDTLRQK